MPTPTLAQAENPRSGKRSFGHVANATGVIDAAVYNQCVRCGLCLPTCPTYLETFVEASGPRGRIALIRAVDEERLDLTDPEFVHQMHECLDCRACEAVCPSGVAYGRLIEPTRAAIEVAVALHRSALQRLGRWFAFDVVFGSLGWIRLTAWFVRFYRASGIRALVRGLGILRALKLEELEAQMPVPSRKFFVPRDQRWRSAMLEVKATAFMHAGCVMHVAFADVNEATVRVMQRAGCDVLAPRGQGCCGALALHAGEPERARTLAKRNIAAFEQSGADVYVVNAAGCGSALKEYGELFAGDPAWGSRAAEFAAKVRDVNEFLDAVGIAPELGPVDAVVTYQEPCHLVHAQRISAAPRRLLRQIPGLELREMNESAVCCGSAGLYNLTQPEMSARLGDRKAANVLDVGPTVVATANPGCALQVAAALRKAGRPIPVKHVVQLLDEAYENYKPTSGVSSASAASMFG